MLLSTLYWPDEIRALGELDLPAEEIEVKPAEKKMASQLIEAMTGEFDPEAYRDEYREALMQVIESKVEGRETVSVAAPEESTNLVDLMAALQASVKAATSARDAKAEKPVSVAEAKARKAAGEPAGGARPAKRAATRSAKPAARDEADEERPARKRKSA
jgi:DNA end-binding protein Ku